MLIVKNPDFNSLMREHKRLVAEFWQLRQDLQQSNLQFQRSVAEIKNDQTMTTRRREFSNQIINREVS